MQEETVLQKCLIKSKELLKPADESYGLFHFCSKSAINISKPLLLAAPMYLKSQMYIATINSNQPRNKMCYKELKMIIFLEKDQDQGIAKTLRNNQQGHPKNSYLYTQKRFTKILLIIGVEKYYIMQIGSYIFFL